MYQLKLLAL